MERESGYYCVKWNYNSEWEIAEYLPKGSMSGGIFKFTSRKESLPINIAEIDERRIERLELQDKIK